MAPNAWPMAIVPPFGSTRSGPASRSRRNRRHSAANASANSNTSMSAGASPAFAMTFSTAVCPAVSMITGSVPAVAER